MKKKWCGIGWIVLYIIIAAPFCRSSVALAAGTAVPSSAALTQAEPIAGTMPTVRTTAIPAARPFFHFLISSSPFLFALMCSADSYLHFSHNNIFPLSEQVLQISFSDKKHLPRDSHDISSPACLVRGVRKTYYDTKVNLSDTMCARGVLESYLPVCP